MTVMTDRKFDKYYNRLVELKTKLSLASEEEKELIEREIKDLEYQLMYLEYVWLYEQLKI